MAKPCRHPPPEADQPTGKPLAPDHRWVLAAIAADQAKECSPLPLLHEPGRRAMTAEGLDSVGGLATRQG